MTDERAKELLADDIQDGGGLLSRHGPYLYWSLNNDTATLDGEFTAEDLEAIAHWMRTHRLATKP